uniref:Uncharacterized protein n=1 Tax=mine drainage metagenome TaxID=410659 RepID=E6QEB0_9ZZZZ
MRTINMARKYDDNQNAAELGAPACCVGARIGTHRDGPAVLDYRPPGRVPKLPSRLARSPEVFPRRADTPEFDSSSAKIVNFVTPPQHS